MSLPFSEYIKQIGKGQRSGKSLSQHQAEDAMNQLLSGRISGEQRGAFLMLLRTRHETVEELIGFVNAAKNQVVSNVLHMDVQLDIGCYAGKRRQLPWYLLAIASLVQSGVRVLMHGAEEPDSGRMYAGHVLPMLGMPLKNCQKGAEEQLASVGATYLDLGMICRPLDELIKLRPLFGLRSCANTLGRLLNPSNAPYSIQGVHHLDVDERHNAINAHFVDTQFLCFRGEGGDPEINTARQTRLLMMRAGAATTCLVPEQRRWNMKDITMNPQRLLDIWHGVSVDAQVNEIIIQTLASYLMLLENKSYESSVHKAKQLWSERDNTVLPFSSKHTF